MLGGELALSVVWVLGFAWGVAISIVATAQLLVAPYLNYLYGRWDVRSLLVGAIYPLAPDR